MRGIVVDFDDQAVGADGGRGHGQGMHQTGDAGGMRGIDQQRQVGETVQDLDDGQVDRVARGGPEGPDAALAQHDVGIAQRSR